MGHRCGICLNWCCSIWHCRSSVRLNGSSYIAWRCISSWSIRDWSNWCQWSLVICGSLIVWFDIFKGARWGSSSHFVKIFWILKKKIFFFLFFLFLFGYQIKKFKIWMILSFNLIFWIAQIKFFSMVYITIIIGRLEIINYKNN